MQKSSFTFLLGRCKITVTMAQVCLFVIREIMKAASGGKKMSAQIKTEKKLKNKNSGWAYFNRHKQIYLFLLPGIILTFIFSYIPLMGLSVAFLDYDVFLGMKSPFVGFDNFVKILSMPQFTQAIWNTLKISLLNIAIAFPLPIVFALLLNELSAGFFKRFTQTVSYLPHFLSTIAVVGIATTLLSNYGVINDLRVAAGGEGTERILFLTLQKMFVPNVLTLELWKSFGWNSIIYLASISGIDAELYEAATIDGAGKFKQSWHITVPCIMNTVIIMLILKIGSLFASNFDLIYGLQNVYIDFEVISTIVYKQGITQGDYATATALSFMQGFISLFLVLGSNWLSKKYNDVSII